MATESVILFSLHLLQQPSHLFTFLKGTSAKSVARQPVSKRFLTGKRYNRKQKNHYNDQSPETYKNQRIHRFSAENQK